MDDAARVLSGHRTAEQGRVREGGIGAGGGGESREGGPDRGGRENMSQNTGEEAERTMTMEEDGAKEAGDGTGRRGRSEAEDEGLWQHVSDRLDQTLAHHLEQVCVSLNVWTGVCVCACDRCR